MRAGQFTVAIAAARHLHLLAAADPLPLAGGFAEPRYPEPREALS